MNPRAAILQREAHAFDSDPRSEIAVDALNPARDISGTVDHGQIGGVAGVDFRGGDLCH